MWPQDVPKSKGGQGGQGGQGENEKLFFCFFWSARLRTRLGEPRTSF